jgi:predicted TIM-barrel fold metal-dependent hydrolase
MIIDGFTLYGSWPGYNEYHPISKIIEAVEKFKLDYACALSSQGIFVDALTGNTNTINDCKTDPRLIPIGTADPRNNGIENIEFCQQNKIRLMALFPNTQGWQPTTLSARSLIEKISSAGMTLMIESSMEGNASAIYTSLIGLDIPVILLDVSLRNLKEAVAVIERRPNTYLASRLLAGGDTIEMLSKTIGSDKVIYNSRFPLSCFSSSFLTAKYATISESDRNLIMGTNMANFLR